MRDSCFLIGCDADEEAALEPLVHGPVRRFFGLAQRCVWGVTQPDIVRVDLDEVVRRIERLYPRCFVSHLLAAFALRSRAPGRADDARLRATELASPDHPWRYLLPTAEEWSGAQPPQRLHPVIPGRVWRVRSQEPAAASSFSIVNQGTLIRLEAGGLAFINPVNLTETLQQQVRSLGPMDLLITQGMAHSRHIDRTRALFPQARVLGTAGLLRHPASAHLHLDALLDTPSARLPEELIELPITGTDASEVVLLHVPTKLLLFQDLVSNNRSDHGARPFAGRLEYFAFGLADRIGWLSYHPALWSDLPRLQSNLRRVLHSDYQHVVGAHWPDAPCAGEARAAFDAGLRWVIALRGSRHKRMVAGFFARQPGFLRDLLVYRRVQRRLAASASPAPQPPVGSVH